MNGNLFRRFSPGNGMLPGPRIFAATPRPASELSAAESQAKLRGPVFRSVTDTLTSLVGGAGRPRLDVQPESTRCLQAPLEARFFSREYQELSAGAAPADHRPRLRVPDLTRSRKRAARMTRGEPACALSRSRSGTRVHAGERVASLRGGRDLLGGVEDLLRGENIAMRTCTGGHLGSPR